MLVFIVAIFLIAFFTILDYAIDALCEEKDHCKYYDGGFVFPYCNLKGEDAKCNNCNKCE